MDDERLDGTTWRDVGKRGVRQALAVLALKQRQEQLIPEGRDAQWAEPSGVGTMPVVCGHAAWREVPGTGNVECESCQTVMRKAEPADEDPF